MRVDVVATADAAVPAGLRGATVLVVDVLRASTTIIAALRSGCAGIVPVGDPEAARHRASALPDGTVLLAGERRGEPIAGFDLGNSPLEFTAERVAGKTVILTTSNGTRALLAAGPAAQVGVAALVNLSAAAAWALGGGSDVTVLCAGERGRPSLEDGVCAGLLVERMLRDEPRLHATVAATAAAELASGYGKDVARLAADSGWARHLASRGRAADVVACLVLDTTTLVPVYRADVDKVVPAHR
ncbi:MAG: 2-phosphosulfolactate phosphatase [Candidatus Rokubacteria bacterium]|nr:2-phosphosulfolactate phosphatase [Candidatus Rokubacteria bacterium]